MACLVSLLQTYFASDIHTVLLQTWNGSRQTREVSEAAAERLVLQVKSVKSSPVNFEGGIEGGVV